MRNDIYSYFMHSLLLYILYRSWQKKIRSLVKDNEHQVEIYACLYALLTERSRKVSFI